MTGYIKFIYLKLKKIIANYYNNYKIHVIMSTKFCDNTTLSKKATAKVFVCFDWPSYMKQFLLTKQTDF